ncbi:MAG: Fe-S cluster assembly protein SufD [Euryarchaeota archaeon]|nr:Fe-S cluster assembly protein SufD [Euryarchaeota archaeon]
MPQSTSEAKSVFMDHFEKRSARGRRDEPASLSKMREAAIKGFGRSGFPNARQEAWKYTDPAPIALTRFKDGDELDTEGLVCAERLSPFSPDGDAVIRLTFVDGRYSKKLSSTAALPPSVLVEPLGEALARGDGEAERHLGSLASPEANPFTAINTGLFAGGSYVWVGAKTVVPAPIHLLFLAISPGEPVAIHPRNLIVLGHGSQAAVIETYASLGNATYLTNAVTEVVVGEDSVLRHYRLQEESETAFHVSRTEVVQQRGSSYHSNNVNVGGRLVRNEINTRFSGEGAECVLDGLFMGRGRQHVDNHTFIDHVVPNCTSRELYKGVLDGEARGVFYGSIAVRKDAQKTNAVQTNKNLLLSKDAMVDSTPQLEILADDVKCRHGSTIGQLDENAMFYMRSRGIGEKQARAILTYAFASDIVARIGIPELREKVDEILMGRFGQNEHTTGVA